MLIKNRVNQSSIENYHKNRVNQGTLHSTLRANQGIVINKNRVIARIMLIKDLLIKELL